MREAADMLESLRFEAAVIVGADSDVIDAGRLDQINDMVGDLRQRRARRRPLARLDRGDPRFDVGDRRRDPGDRRHDAGNWRNLGARRRRRKRDWRR